MNTLRLGISLNSSQYGGGGGVPAGDWILATGFWEDLNVWRDDQTWID